MRYIQILGWGVLCWSTLVGAKGAENEIDPAIPYVKNDGEIRVLPRTRPDRQYQLYIGLPESYKSEPTRKYPVIYVTDGYWNYSTIRSHYFGLRYDKTIPEAIIVGLSYVGENLDYNSLRQDDLGPPIEFHSKDAGTTFVQHGDQFLNLIETVAIPLMEREYRADPKHRVLLGGSAGGLFTLYAMFTKPELFQGYVAASPSIGPLTFFEEEFARSGRSVDARVYASIGVHEWPAYYKSVISFDQRLSHRSYLKGGYQFRKIEGMRHCGAIAEGVVQGLQYVFEPTAPERGVAADDSLPNDPTRGLYEVHFNRTSLLKEEAAWTADQKEVMRRHRLWLDDLSKDKAVLGNVRTPEGSRHTFSGFIIFAQDQKEAERIAATAPVVAAGLMAVEIICVKEKPPQPAK